MSGSGIAIHGLLCSRHFSSSIVQNLVPFARGNRAPLGPENPKRHYCSYIILANSALKVNANPLAKRNKISRNFWCFFTLVFFVASNLTDYYESGFFAVFFFIYPQF